MGRSVHRIRPVHAGALGSLFFVVLVGVCEIHPALRRSVDAEDRPPVAEQIDSLIQQLGADGFDDRERASRELAKIGRPALEALRGARSDPDPEVRSRATVLFTRVRWGIPENASDTATTILAEFEAVPPKERARIIQELEALKLPLLRPVLVAVWRELDDPETVADVAERWIRVHTLLAEERLRALESRQDPRVLKVLGDLLQFRGDFSGAADQYARVEQLAPGAAIRELRLKALSAAHRDSEIVELIAGAESPTPGDLLAHIEALYRCDRRADAETLLHQFRPGAAGPPEGHPRAVEMALKHGSPQCAIDPLDAPSHEPPEVLTRLWLDLGDTGKAESAWRSIERGEVDPRRRLLTDLLCARGDFDLLSPSFLDEALAEEKPSPDAHLIAARSLAATEPSSALTCLRKHLFLYPDDAALWRECGRLAEKAGDPARAIEAWGRVAVLDPGPGDAAGEVRRLEASRPERRPRGTGIRTREAPVAYPERLCAMPPVRIGAFTYFVNQEGCLLKSTGVLQSRPIWSHPLPRRGRVNHRGWQYEWYPWKTQIGAWEGKIVALTDQGSHVHSGEGSGGSDGYELCVIDDATGREVFSRSFPEMEDGRLFPDAGLVGFITSGVALFDLSTRDWRWAFAGLDQGSGEMWIDNDSVYVGFSSGLLCRLQAGDGALVWRQEYPDDPGRYSRLIGIGRSLLFIPGGGAVTSVSLDSGAVEWQRRIPFANMSITLTPGSDRVWMWCWNGREVLCLRLSDGGVLWSREMMGADARVEFQHVPPHILGGGIGHEVLLLDAESGRVMRGGAVESSGWGGGVYFREGDRLFFSSASVNDYFIRMTKDIDPTRAPKLHEVIFVPGGIDPGGMKPDGHAEEKLDPFAAISRAEARCYGSPSRGADDWLDLTAARIEAHEPGRAIESFRHWLEPAASDPEVLSSWIDRLDAAVQKRARDLGREPWDLTQSIRGLRSLLDQLQLERAILRGDLTRLATAGGLSSSDAVRDALSALPPDRLCEAIEALARKHDAVALRLIQGALGKMDDAHALKALGALIRPALAGPESDSPWSPMFLRSRRELVRELTGLLSREDHALRGAALATLDLMREEVGSGDERPSLIAAFESGDPRVRLAAAAALYRRGSTASGEELERVAKDAENPDNELAICLAGQARLENLLHLLTEPQKRESTVRVRALADLGTPEAWKRVCEISRKPDIMLNNMLTIVLRGHRSPETERALIEMTLNPGSHHHAMAGLWGLVGSTTPEARGALIQFAGEEVAVDPMAMQVRAQLILALLDEARLDEAAMQIERAVASWPPVRCVEAWRLELLSRTGDLSGARHARDSVRAGLLRCRSLEPGRWQHAFDIGRLYVEPASIAEHAEARRWLTEALALSPGNKQVLERLEKTEGK